MIPRLLAVVLSLVAATPALPQDTPAGRVDRLLERLSDYGFAGSIAVAVEGATVHSAGYGLADRERVVAVGPDTRFDIGSLTKPFTAAVILRLAEEGVLSVGDSLGGLLPDVPAAMSGITVERLLTHTSGLVRSAGSLDVEADATREEFLAAVLGSELLFPPGERFEYSDTGYDLLAAIAELKTGEPFPALVERLVIRPAGLEQTGYATGEEATADVAWAYSSAFGSPWADDREGPSAPTWYNLGSGGLVSTTGDLLAFESALWAGEILAPATVERMTHGHVEVGGGRSYGYGWFVSDGPNGRVVYHGGDISGYKAHLARYVESDLVFAALGSVLGWERAIDRDAISAWFGEGPSLPPAREDAPDESFAGTYRTAEGDPIVVWVEAERIVVETAGQPAVDLVFRAAGGETAERTRVAGEVIEALGRGDQAFLESLLRERDRAGGFAGFLISIWGRLEQRSGPARSHAVLGSYAAQDGTVVSLIEVQRDGGSERMRLIWRGDRLVTAGGDEGLRRPTALFVPTGPGTAARYADASGTTTTLRLENGAIRIESPAGEAVVTRDERNPIEPPRRSLVRALVPVFLQEGSEAGLARLRQERSTDPDGYDFGEFAVNDLGYALLHAADLEGAIAVFRQNVEEHPESGNTHDSLGEAYLAAGRMEEARSSYAEALRLDPENERAREVVEGPEE